MSGYRRAALALHGLGPQDRNWILDALPGPDKAALQACLKELKELGFAPDALSLAELAHDAPAALPRVPPNAAARLRAADGAALFALLEHEPNGLIGQLLAIEAWPWAEQVLGMFGAPRQGKIRAAQQASSAPAGARTAWLLEAVAAPLGRAAPAPAARAPGPVGALLARLGRGQPQTWSSSGSM